MDIRFWNRLLLLFPIYVIVVSLNITQARMLPLVWNPTYKIESVSNSKTATERNRVSMKQFGYIEIMPNGTLLLRSRKENGTHLQYCSNLKSMLGIVKLTPPLVNINGKWNIKIYGDGTELKFPPFLERILQRIQTYFSVYKYTDTSVAESSLIPEESSNLQVNFDPTPNNVTVNSFIESTNNNSADMFASGSTDFQHQHASYLDVESATQEDNNEYTEFIEIDENDDAFIVVGKN